MYRLISTLNDKPRYKWLYNILLAIGVSWLTKNELDNLLFKAVSQNNQFGVKILLTRGADPNTKDDSGNHILYNAVFCEKSVRHNASETLTEKERDTTQKIMEILLEKGASIKIENVMDGSVLHKIIKKLPTSQTNHVLRSTEKTKILIGLVGKEASDDLNIQDTNKNTVLHITLGTITHSSVDPKNPIIYKDQSTISSSYFIPEISEQLIKSGASINIKNNRHETAVTLFERLCPKSNLNPSSVEQNIGKKMINAHNSAISDTVNQVTSEPELPPQHLTTGKTITTGNQNSQPQAPPKFSEKMTQAFLQAKAGSAKTNIQQTGALTGSLPPDDQEITARRPDNVGAHDIFHTNQTAGDHSRKDTECYNEANSNQQHHKSGSDYGNTKVINDASDGGNRSLRARLKGALHKVNKTIKKEGRELVGKLGKGVDKLPSSTLVNIHVSQQDQSQARS